MAPSKASKRYRSPKCSALGCNSKFKKSHGYPTDPVLATAWALAALRPDILDALERPPFKLSHRLCSLHFEEDAYYDPPSLYKLKPFALPTLFENKQGELVRVKTDPEIEKLVSLKKAGIKVEADEFLKQVIRETEWSHSSTEEFRLLPSKRFKFDDPVVVKAEMPEISPTSETLDEHKLPNNCSIRVKDVVIDYADMCKIETFEFVPAEPLHAIKTDPDLIEVQRSSPDLKPVPEADNDDDVICVTDIDPLQTDECQAYEFSNGTTNTNTESTAEYAVQQSLHTTLDIKEETDDDIVWITNPLETDHQHSDTLKVEISESETELVQNNNAVQKMYPELADKEVQTPIELSVSTAQGKKMQVVLQQTLDVNKYLRERLTEAEEDLKICSKDVCEAVTLDEYANYTKTFFPDATMSKFVLDLLEVNQAPEVREKCRKNLVEPKAKNDAQKADVFNFYKQRNKVKPGRSSISNKEINQAAPAKLKEGVTEVMEVCHNHVTEPKVKNDAQKTRVFDFSKHQSRVKSGKSSPSNKDTKQPQPSIKQEDETQDAIMNKSQPNRFALPLRSKVFQNAAPCPSKLRNRVKASIQPGVSKTWMDLLKIKAETFDDFQRPCVLYMDEVRLKPNVYYNITSDKIVGVLPDAVTGQAVPARYATLMMVQGMCDEWQQPVAYHFSCTKCGSSKLKRMLTEAVETLTGFNLKVMALMCSADQNFVQMAQQLGVSVERPQFCLAGQKIHFLFDVQRLSRDLWNCFLTVNMRFNGSIISGRYLKPV
ncbi:unnamed protein product [Callosobruchus maculatus]|uniref:THAP-type domain-containing protein n=1 Tax=Callosobruchus maculatus TaxID=64391 RepID=A0A653D1T0_CALMS|nr:unnamed protein product [Callosobruchus maculatus]